MTHLCNNICEVLETPAPFRTYEHSRRCGLCKKFIATDKIHCPCCGDKLRTKRKWK